MSIVITAHDYAMPLSDLQNLLLRRLADLEKSQCGAAEAADLPRETIYNVIRRSRQPRYETLEKICDALDLDITIQPKRRNSDSTASRTTHLPLAAWFRRLSADYEGLNALGRRRLVKRFELTFPELVRSGKASPNHVEENVFRKGL